jgi:hypothetical protein
MNIRFNDLYKKAASAAAALAISAVFIGAAVGPAVNAPTTAQANVERAAA